MVVDTLEETTNPVSVNCSGCGRDLEISAADYKVIEKARNSSCQGQLSNPILGKQYEGFYVSPEDGLKGKIGFYCNKTCHTFATED